MDSKLLFAMELFWKRCSNSCDVLGTVCAKPSLMTRAYGSVAAVRKSAVVCLRGHSKPKASKYGLARSLSPKKMHRPSSMTRTLSNSCY